MIVTKTFWINTRNRNDKFVSLIIKTIWQLKHLNNKTSQIALNIKLESFQAKDTKI